jgi:hypothetical protein
LPSRVTQGTATATADHPEVCNVLENILSEFVGATVTKCCDRYDRLRCCFEIAAIWKPVRGLNTKASTVKTPSDSALVRLIQFCS